MNRPRKIFAQQSTDKRNPGRSIPRHGTKATRNKTSRRRHRKHRAYYLSKSRSHTVRIGDVIQRQLRLSHFRQTSRAFLDFIVKIIASLLKTYRLKYICYALCRCVCCMPHKLPKIRNFTIVQLFILRLSSIFLRLYIIVIAVRLHPLIGISQRKHSHNEPSRLFQVKMLLNVRRKVSKVFVYILDYPFCRIPLVNQRLSNADSMVIIIGVILLRRKVIVL